MSRAPQHLKADFQDLVASVFPRTNGRWIAPEKAPLFSGNGGGQVIYDQAQKAMHARVGGDKDPVWAHTFKHHPPAAAAEFLAVLVELFQQDLTRFNAAGKDPILWHSLKHTRFRRGMSQVVGFKPDLAAQWIEVLENSLALTYESKPVRYAVAFTKTMAKAPAQITERMVHFKNPIQVAKALLEEKWIRAVVDGEKVALLGEERDNGRLAGFFSLSDLGWPDKERLLYAPHSKWVRLQHAIGGEGMAFVASPAGDLFLMAGNGTVFHKTQGKWMFANHGAVQEMVSECVSPEVAIAVLRAAYDLSYERKGALFCILDEGVSAADLVRDHGNQKRPNHDLRLVMSGRSIDSGWRTQEAITAAATTDGATILSRSGTVLDIACMIAPSAESFAKRGRKEPPTARGARTTAALQASCFGLVIKVSEDGPITLYKDGREVGWVG